MVDPQVGYAASGTLSDRLDTRELESGEQILDPALLDTSYMSGYFKMIDS